jgi:DNA polymerase-1
VKKKKFILIDGNSLVYRAFFALPTSLSLSSGQPTNAVYGFTSMLIRLVSDVKPEAVIVAFDKGKVTFRHQHYKEYKATRKPTPDELKSQFPLVKEVLSALNIPIFELEGYEADDVIATIAKQNQNKAEKIVIVTGDRDAFQLVDSNIQVMATKRGITDIVTYDKRKVKERLGVYPKEVADYIGLKGDASDNIPGVPGIGEKTAAKLIQQFGCLEAIFSHLEQIEPPKLRKSLSQYREQAILSKNLAILDANLPLKADLNNYKLDKWHTEEVKSVFSRLQFNTLLSRLNKLEVSSSPPKTTLDVKLVQIKYDNLEKVKSAIVGNPYFALNLMPIANSSKFMLLLSYFKDGKLISAYLKTSIRELERELEIKNFLKFICESDKEKVVHNFKSYLGLLRQIGVAIKPPIFDLMLAGYLVNSSTGNYELEDLINVYGDFDLSSLGDLNQISEVERQSLKLAGGLSITKHLKQLLEAAHLTNLLNDLEIPLSFVIAKMEETGVGVNVSELRKLSSKVDEQLKELESQIFILAGEKFNLNSHKQVAKILYQRLGLEKGKKTRTKTGYSTDSSVLKKLVGRHPVVEQITQYRELAKLKSTYIDGLLELVEKRSCRLHTTFSQTATATGRLSSSKPNLQNIPIRSSLGREIRSLFIPTHKYEKLLSADYSQIELRLLAHFSGDKHLIELFQQGVDIHLATAKEIFAVSEARVDQAMRRQAKAVNFGIVYGISSFGLAEQLGISKEEAKKYINTYLNRYPQVKQYLKSTIEQAKKNGYVTTLLGRRRYLPELSSRSYQVRSFGERAAVNTPLQGSAADIIKLAMVAIDKEVTSLGLQAKMVLQVHDELIFEVPPLEEEILKSMVKQLMENVVKLRVPLKIDLQLKANW